MKKYTKMIPILLYPYIYLVFIIVFLIMMVTHVELSETAETFLIAFVFLFAIGYNLACYIIAIYNAIKSGRGKYPIVSSAKINMMVKLIHIPAYIFHFIVGLVGILMSIWGIGFVIWAIVIDFLTILITGINSIGISCQMKKEGYLKTKFAVLTGIGSCLYCWDVPISIFYYIWIKKVDYQRKKEIES